MTSKILKLVVLGATGPTGLQLVEQALQGNHHVTAIVRSPAKLNHLLHTNLKVVEASITDVDVLSSHFKDKDAILSCLGNTAMYYTPWRKSTFYSDSIKVIVEAMEKSESTRFVCITAQSTYTDTTEIANWTFSNKFFYWFIWRPVFGNLLKGINADMHEMEKYLFGLSDINYTIVKPPFLTNGALTGDCACAEGQNVPAETWLQAFSSGWISRADVANFMLRCLETETWDKKAVAVDRKR